MTKNFASFLFNSFEKLFIGDKARFVNFAFRNYDEMVFFAECYFFNQIISGHFDLSLQYI